nr:glutamine synthetase [Sinorhizobium medicae]
MRLATASGREGWGVAVEKHHHDLAPAQHELGIKFNTQVRTADAVQIYKYCVLTAASGDL